MEEVIVGLQEQDICVLRLMSKDYFQAKITIKLTNFQGYEINLPSVKII